MFQRSIQSPGVTRRLVWTVTAIILALGLCSCQTAGISDITGSLGEKTEASRAADIRRELGALA